MLLESTACCCLWETSCGYVRRRHVSDPPGAGPASRFVCYISHPPHKSGYDASP